MIRPRIAALAALAVGVGLACGAGSRDRHRAARLPKAGSVQDDGTGILARWSMAAPTATDTTPTATTDGDGDKGMYGASLYGGAAGGATYGGSLYAGYKYAEVVRTAPLVQPAPYVGYAPRAVPNAGAIAGKVTWPRPPAAAATLPAPTSDGCPAAIPNDTLVVGAGGGVANAVVYLDDITAGRGTEPIGGVLERAGCRLRPHVSVVAPVGAPLRFTDSDPGARRHVVAHTQPGVSPLALDTDGNGHAVRVDPGVAGFYEIRPDVDGDLASAWIVVPKHPYYAITDADGRFRLDGVPPGTYRLRVWHEPVRTDGGRTKAVVATARVRVTARHTATVSVSLPSGR